MACSLDIALEAISVRFPTSPKLQKHTKTVVFSIFSHFSRGRSWNNFWIDFGIILGGKMLTKPHQKVDEICIDFLLSFSRKMILKWSPNATPNDPRCRQVADIIPTSALGRQREPKGSQKGAQMDPKWSSNQAKNKQSGAGSGHLAQDLWALDTGLGI